MSSEIAENPHESHAGAAKPAVDTSEATAMVTDTPEEPSVAPEAPTVVDPPVAVEPGAPATEAAEAKGSSATNETTPAVAIPSLIGKISAENVFTGQWAMSDAAHKIPGQTSGFEYKLVKPFVPEAPPAGQPSSGKYAGFFYLMMNGKSIKIEETNLMLSFSVVEGTDGEGQEFTVLGDGSNKFGKFSVRGKYSLAVGAHLYKEYTYAPAAASASATKKRPAGSSSASPSPAKQQKSGDGGSRPPPLNMAGLGGAGSSAGVATPGGSFTPREGSGRARKPSIHVIEAKADLPPPPQPKPTPKAVTTPKAAAAAPKAAAGAKATAAAKGSSPSAPPKPPLVMSAAEAAAAAKKAESNRTQRLSQAMIRCSDLLKELMKHPAGVYFLVPVDPVRLQCPDYPSIITQPMDFGTIKQRLEQGVISSMESFAEHVRLVMRNALTYNSDKTSPVHMAASSLSTRFEDKFGKISAAFQNQQSLYQEPTAAIAAAAKSAAGKKSAAAGRQRMSTGSMPQGGKLVGASSQARLGVAGGPPAYTAPAMDASAHQILEMQRMMAEMQAEINKLRSTVMQNEVRSLLEEKKEAAQTPLTFEEKKALIQRIGELAPLKMQQVVEIIQAAVAASGREVEDDVEIPLDDLDTFTLRRLQRFVDQDLQDRRKRSLGGGGGGEASISPYAGGNKKGRKEPTGAPRGRKPNPEKAAARAAAAAQQAQQTQRGAIFAPQSFDALRGGGAGAAGADDDYAVGEDLEEGGLDLDMAEDLPPAPSSSSSSHTHSHSSTVVAAGTVHSANPNPNSDALVSGLWGASAQVTHTHTVHDNFESLPSSSTAQDDEDGGGGDYHMDQSQDDFEALDTDNL